MMNLPVNENLLSAEQALKKATCDNIVELCEKYLQSLKEYREELYKFRGAPEINLQQSSPLARELREPVEQKRNAIRTELEIITRKRNEIESLLQSFTSINGYEAVKTFNRLEYKGFISWELRANEVRPQNDDNNERMTIHEAVETASRLRRQAYIAYQTTFPR
ncbi:MAG TPA: hypothetical protein VGB00_13590 [Pyrinomonadaceae bacterium]|jgi:hypothetical protein